MIKNIFLTFTIIFLISCSDKAQTNTYDKSELKKVHCLKLKITPNRLDWDLYLPKLYHFEQNCPYTLEVSYKENITCNSNQNVQRKALTAFPNTYLRMEIKKNSQLIYSYYIDLQQHITKDKLKEAIDTISKNLNNSHKDQK